MFSPVCYVSAETGEEGNMFQKSLPSNRNLYEVILIQR